MKNLDELCKRNEISLSMQNKVTKLFLFEKENGFSVAILYYLWIHFFWIIKVMVNNILEYYYPLTFPTIKTKSQKTLYFRFSQWCYPLRYKEYILHVRHSSLNPTQICCRAPQKKTLHEVLDFLKNCLGSISPKRLA